MGAGPGDPSLLTVAASDALKRADVVLRDPYISLRLSQFFTKSDTENIDVGANPWEISTTAPHVRTMIDYALEGRRVVRLLAGDGMMFAGLAEELLACQQAGVQFEVVPGVSWASSACFAGVPLTPRGLGSVHVFDTHRDNVRYGSAADPNDTVVMLGHEESILQGIDLLMAAGRPADSPIVLTADGSTSRQRSIVMTLGSARKTMRSVNLGQSPVIAVSGTGVELREQTQWFESKPLFGWRVLLPSTKSREPEATVRLSELGAVGTVVPMTSIEPPRTPQQIDRAVRALVDGDYQWIGFTSVYAVRAFRTRFTDYGLDSRAFCGVRIASVQGEAADALQDWGITPDLVAEAPGIGALLEAWPEHDEDLDPSNRVLLPRADISTDTLIEGLGKLGWDVDDVTAYRTVRAAPPPVHIRDAIKQGSYDAVLFTSPACVRNLVGIAGKPHRATLIACIGPASAKAAADLGLRVDIIAQKPEELELIEDLADHAHALRLAAIEAGVDSYRPSEKRRGGLRRAR